MTEGIDAFMTLESLRGLVVVEPAGSEIYTYSLSIQTYDAHTNVATIRRGTEKTMQNEQKNMFNNAEVLRGRDD